MHLSAAWSYHHSYFNERSVCGLSLQFLLLPRSIPASCISSSQGSLIGPKEMRMTPPPAVSEIDGRPHTTRDRWSCQRGPREAIRRKTRQMMLAGLTFDSRDRLPYPPLLLPRRLLVSKTNISGGLAMLRWLGWYLGRCFQIWEVMYHFLGFFQVASLPRQFT